MPKSKIFPSFAAAVADIPDNVGDRLWRVRRRRQPVNLYGALAKQGAKGLTCVSNGTRGGATLPEDAPTMEWLIQQRPGEEGGLRLHRADPRLAAAGRSASITKAA